MNVEQRYSIKFCVLLKKSKAETLDMIQQAYGEKAMSKTRIYEWYGAFSAGRSNPLHSVGAGRPTTSKTSKNVERVKQLIDEDRRVSVRDLADRLDLSYGVVQDILKSKLNMRKVSARWVPKLLNEKQRASRVSSANEFLSRYRRLGNKFLDSIVTVDETWVSTFDPESKKQSMIWKTPASPSPQKALVQRSRRKRLFVVFYDVDGVILSHALPEGKTMNATRYSKVSYLNFTSLHFI
ncbi:MAG: hypothetical protein AB2693_27055 [Candidatus Thiodiazotropha sp.]